MVDLLESDRRKKINDTKDQDHYIDCRYIFGSETHAEILSSHYIYIKNKDPQYVDTITFEGIIFLKSNRKLWQIHNN